MYEYVGARKNDVLKNSNEFYVDDVCYKIASTPSVILQYYELLEKIYQEKFSKTFQVTAQEHWFNNRFGKIIVAIDDSNRVIGGARVIISSPANRCLLPLESKSLLLNDLFPEMNLNQCVYSEWGRYIVDPRIDNKSIVSENIARLCVRKSLEYGSQYLFGLPIVILKNRYETIFSNMHLTFKELIPFELTPKHPSFPSVDLYLAVTELHEVKFSQYPLVKENLL
jgi:hypothetical protein